MSNEGPNKKEQFELLSEIGMSVPLFGTVAQLAASRHDIDLLKVLGEDHEFQAWEKNLTTFQQDQEYVIVYDDIEAHNGAGKRRMTWSAALRECPDAFASEYIAPLGEHPVSWRHLHVGDRGFVIQYKSLGDTWRSNVGDVQIDIIGEIEDRTVIANIPYLLYAVDYVHVGFGLVKAVDFNIAPGMSGFGLEEKLPAPEVYEAFLRADKWLQEADTVVELEESSDDTA